jgi:parvulin-like peptidyl-prolyl isomerase
MAWLSAFGAQRLIVLVTGLLVLIAVGLLAYAWYDQYVAPRRALAVRVGDKAYTMEYFAKRYSAAIKDPPAGINLQRGLLTELPEAVRKGIEDEAVAVQRAGELGISVGQNEIDRQMVLRLNMSVLAQGDSTDENAAFTPTPAMRSTIRGELKRNRMTLEEYRGLTEAQLLLTKIDNYFKEQVPKEAPQFRLRLLQLPNESDAQIATQKIQSGESTLAELADTVGLDQSGRGRGGLRDWLPRGILPKELDDAAFSLPLNTLSPPIKVGDQDWFLVQVEERADKREVTNEEVIGQLKDKAKQAWYDAKRAELGVTNALTEKKIRWAYSWLNNAPTAATGLPGAPGVPGVPGGSAPLVPPGSSPLAPPEVPVPGQQPPQPQQPPSQP